MEFLNNSRRISWLLILLTVAVLSCKKKDEHTSYYFDSLPGYPDRNDEAQTQPVASDLDVYQISNPAPYDKLMADGSPYELVWLRAQKSIDFVPLNSAPPVDDNSRTQMRVLYDISSPNPGVYIAVYCWDKSITFNNVPNTADLRNKSDLVCIYIEPDASNSNIYSIQISPNGNNLDGVISTPGSGLTIPSGYPGGYTARSYINYNPNNGSILGWYAEIKIPFNPNTTFNLSQPIPGTTSWRMNVVRENFDSIPGGVTSRGRYGWKNPLSLTEDNPAVFNTIHFTTTFCDTKPFSVGLKGQIISAGPVNVPNCGFECTVNKSPFGASNVSNFELPLGNRVNPGLVTTSYGVNVGDSINYRMWVINPDNSKSYSKTVQKIKVR